MREGWKEVNLGDISLMIKRGVSPKYVEQDGVVVINQKCVRSSKINFDEARLTSKDKKISQEKYVQVGDVLVNSTGTGTLGRTGYVSYLNDETTVDTHVTIVRANNDIVDRRFIGFVLSLYEPIIENLGKGATNQIELSAKDLASLKINLPPLETQRKIASILSGYDDLIENNLKRIKILEEMAQQTYEEWFVRMRFPGYETAVMNEETGLPEGWEKVKIQNLCTVSGGGTPSKIVDEYWENGNINWFTPTDLSKNNSLVISDSGLKTNELGIKKSSAKVLQPNSFVMTSRATIGLFALIDKPFSTNQGFINTTPNRSNLKAYLLYNFKYRIDELMGLATGATFPELSKSKFKVLAVNKPTESVLNPFEELTNNIFKQLFNLSSQNQRLRESRDLLLPRLMMGIIEVDGLIVNEDLAMVSEESEKYNKL